MKVYQLKVSTETLDGSYLYNNHPTREDIITLLSVIWRRLKLKSQNQCWDLLMVAYTCPTEPWLGRFSNPFGSLEIREYGVLTTKPTAGEVP